MDRLKKRRVFALRINVARRSYSDGSGTSRTEVGKNISKEIGSNDNIKSIGIKNEVCNQNIDVVLPRLSP